jgi:hypothetical protein
VNCNGTGVITRVITLADGTKASQLDDFVITGAIVRRGQLVVTSIVDAVRTPSIIVPGGIFLSRIWTRLPDESDVLLEAVPR